MSMQVATSCGERMHEIVAEEATAAAGTGDEAARWRGVMEKSYARMDAEAVGSSRNAGPAPPTCRCEMQLPKCDHVGSTAVVAVVGPRHLVVANAGDSRAVLCSGGAAIPLSSDHKVFYATNISSTANCSELSIFSQSLRTMNGVVLNKEIPLLFDFSLTVPTSWSGSKRRAGASSSGTARACSACWPCRAPSATAT